MGEKLCYHYTGIEPKIGDRMLLADMNHLVVESVHVTIESLREIGLDESSEFSVMTVGEDFGHMFVSLSDQELEFIARANECAG